MTWYVTYLLIFPNGSTEESVESFAYNPTGIDINDVGGQIAEQMGATTFVASRGKRNWNGEWIDYE
ncbi:MAG: hypothetical protein IKU15_03610 [Clostridia bacterium]|nr:hypothetical protein [Clostridia bacterium]